MTRAEIIDIIVKNVRTWQAVTGITGTTEDDVKSVARSLHAWASARLSRYPNTPEQADDWRFFRDVTLDVIENTYRPSTGFSRDHVLSLV